MIRQKYRWLYFELISKKKFMKDEIISVLSRKSLELFGTFGAVDFFLYDFDYDNQVGIIKCLARDLDKLRITLALIKEISGEPVLINDRYVSGTLKKLREKIKNLDLISKRFSLGDLNG